MPKISYFKWFWVIFTFMNGLLSIILYCLQKQRKELGCSGSFSHDDSVYNEMSRVPWFMQQRFWGLCRRCPFSELTRDAVWCSFILGSSFHGVLGKNYDQYICLAHRKSLLWISFFPSSFKQRILEVSGENHICFSLHSFALREFPQFYDLSIK